MGWHVTSIYYILKQLWCVIVKNFFQHEYSTYYFYFLFLYFFFSFCLFWFLIFLLFVFPHGLAISFHFEFKKKKKKWKYQIILFDLPIVSLDIAKIDHAPKINLAFAFLK